MRIITNFTILRTIQLYTIIILILLASEQLNKTKTTIIKANIIVLTLPAQTTPSSSTIQAPTSSTPSASDNNNSKQSKSTIATVTVTQEPSNNSINLPLLAEILGIIVALLTTITTILSLCIKRINNKYQRQKKTNKGKELYDHQATQFRPPQYEVANNQFGIGPSTQFSQQNPHFIQK